MQTCPQSSTPSGGSLEGRAAPGGDSGFGAGHHTHTGRQPALGGTARENVVRVPSCGRRPPLPRRPRPPATTARGKVRMSHPHLPGQHSRGAAGRIQTPSQGLSRRRRALRKAPSPCRGPRQARRPGPVSAAWTPGPRALPQECTAARQAQACDACPTSASAVENTDLECAPYGPGPPATRRRGAAPSSYHSRPGSPTPPSRARCPPGPQPQKAGASAPWFCR